MSARARAVGAAASINKFTMKSCKHLSLGSAAVLGVLGAFNPRFFSSSSRRMSASLSPHGTASFDVVL